VPYLHDFKVIDGFLRQGFPTNRAAVPPRGGADDIAERRRRLHSASEGQYPGPLSVQLVDRVQVRPRTILDEFLLFLFRSDLGHLLPLHVLLQSWQRNVLVIRQDTTIPSRVRIGWKWNNAILRKTAKVRE